MSRFFSFARGLSASWVAAFVVAAYSLTSVPLAIHYLGAEQFGLWALLLQVQGYFSLIEIGMTGAAGRILIDHKDSPSAPQYIGTLSTSNVIFVVQAFLIAFIGWFSAPALAALLDIPQAYGSQFTLLLQLAAAVAGLGIVVRVSGALLYAHQRLDLLNFSSIFSMLLGLAVMWLALAAGAGLYALIVSQFVAWLVSTIFAITCCYRLKFFRMADLCTGISLKRAKELLNFGKDMFAFNLGSQLLDASQIVIVTKTMGLQAAAMWAVSSKLFVLVSQLVSRLQGVAMVYFAEMIVRRENCLLKKRFRHVYQLGASLAVSAVAVVVATNTSFVSLWTERSLAWTNTCNILFALLILVNSCCRCSSELIIHTKNMSRLRFIYFIEGSVFVGLATVFARNYGFPGILLAALLCAIVFRGIYVTETVSRLLLVSRSSLFLGWLKRAILSAALLLPTAALISYTLQRSALSAVTEFALAFVSSSLVASALIVAIGCPKDIRAELLRRLGDLFIRYRGCRNGCD